MMNLAIPFNPVYLLLIVYFPLFSSAWSLWNLQLQCMKNLQLSSKKTQIDRFMDVEPIEGY